MNISPIFFYLLAVVAVAFSLVVVLKKNPVSSAFSLLVVFFCFSGIYALMDAHLIAVLQILLYAGAIMVLFVFVIMLLNADAPSFDLGRTRWPLRVAAGVLCLVLFGLVMWTFKNSALLAPKGTFTVERIAAAGGNTRVLSEVLFSEYILPFELTSVLLLAAVVAAVTLAKRRNPEKKEVARER